MKKFLLRPPSPALVVSFVALLVALGGTSYATITSLPANSVGAKQLKDSAVITKKLHDGAVTGAKLAKQPHFIAPTLSPGYSNFGPAWSNAGYEKDALGFVHLRGTLTCPTVGTAFTLPVGYRPTSDLLMTEGTNTGAQWLTVGSDGSVRTRSDDGICGLDGLSFPAAGTAGTSRLAARSAPPPARGAVR